MKRLALILLPLALLGCSDSGKVKDREWTQILTRKDGVVTYARKPQSESKSLKKAWVKDVNKDGAYSVGLWAFDCKANKMGILANYVYGKDSKKGAESGGERPRVEFVHIIPDTNGETLRDYAC
ncbi:MAG: hypothetical protein LBK01_00090, partial [Burkholderiaceae bacterium]|nr:hypothetical protein [Burkholderiaceae bacterium]